jgi:hypothetical protein
VLRESGYFVNAMTHQKKADRPLAAACFAAGPLETRVIGEAIGEASALKRLRDIMTTPLVSTPEQAQFSVLQFNHIA